MPPAPVSESDAVCLADTAWARSPFRRDLLHGQVALVTGGGSGICFRVAEAYLRHGCKVAIVSRSQKRLDQAAETLRASTGGEVLAVACDVRDFEAVLEMVGRVLSHFGRLDICVNGAAGNFLAQADSLSSRAFRTVMEIDTLGTFNVSRAVFDKYMREHGGSIINITATLHLNGVPMQAHAAAAKAAIEGFTRVLCNEWGCHGVRVNCLAPGPIADTEGFRRLGGFMPEEYIAEYRRTIPLQRFGSSLDMANSCLFLGSEAASYVTGAVLIADGGAWMEKGAGSAMSSKL